MSVVQEFPRCFAIDFFDELGAQERAGSVHGDKEMALGAGAAYLRQLENTLMLSPALQRRARQIHYRALQGIEETFQGRYHVPPL